MAYSITRPDGTIERIAARTAVSRRVRRKTLLHCADYIKPEVGYGGQKSSPTSVFSLRTRRSVQHIEELALRVRLDLTTWPETLCRSCTMATGGCEGMLAFLLDLVGHDGERAEQLLDKCLEEGVANVDTLLLLETVGLQQLGFKLGDIAKLKSKSESCGRDAQKAKIAGLIKDIKSQTRTHAQSSNGSKKSSTPRHKFQKLSFGWLNWTKTQYRQVKKSDGGGTRTVQYDCNQPQTVSTLLAKGRELFFPGGNSPLGPGEKFTFQLGNFACKVISEFTDLEGEQCSFQDYLKARGLYASKHNVYIMTTQKYTETIASSMDSSSLGPLLEPDENDAFDVVTSKMSEAAIDNLATSSQDITSEDVHSIEAKINPNEDKTCHTMEQCLCVVDPNGMPVSPKSLSIKYTREIVSQYTGVTSHLSCYSMEECHRTTFTAEANEISQDLFLPTEHGFQISEIISDGEKLLTLDHSTNPPVFKFPSTQRPARDIILHSPDQLFGYEHCKTGKQLVIGVVASCHGQMCKYIWFKDGSQQVSGSGNACIPVKEGGVYAVAVEYDNTLYICENTVTVKRFNTIPAKNISIVPAKISERSPGDFADDIKEAHEDMIHSQSEQIDHGSVEQFAMCVEEESLAASSVKSDNDTNNNRPCKRSKLDLDSHRSSLVTQSSRSSNLSGSIGSITQVQQDKSMKSHVAHIHQGDVSNLVVIGQGASSTVYKGDWLGTTVAVKRIHVKRMRLMQATIEREVQLHSRICHPNIVQLLSYYTDASSLFLVCEYVEGMNLDDLLFGKNDTTLTFCQKLYICKQLLQAVAYLHGTQIIHQDIKPENILVSHKTLVTKLCDMGLSKIKRDSSGLTTNMGGSIQPGTPMYQAPEVLVRGMRADVTTDIWSVGCSLTELFAETNAWDMDQIYEHMAKEEHPTGVHTLLKRTDVPDLLKNLILQCLKYDASQRPSALEVLMKIKSLM